MEEIISAFGIDVRLITIQIINFVVLLFALWYFLYTPILKLLADRQEKIKKGVEDAEAAEQSLEEAENTKKEIVAAAHRESEEIVKKAEQHAETKKSEILESAEVRAESLVLAAEKEAAEKVERIKTGAEKEIAQTAVLAAEKIMLEKQNS